jgi:CubicO group peptidase (beta-lactamase class C family)
VKLWQRSSVAILSLLLVLPAHATDRFDHLESELDDLRRANGVPAVGLVIVEDGHTRLATAWGGTGNPQHPAADRQTYFRVGSITKSFTALAVLDLIADGKVTLDTPLDDIVGTDVVRNPWRDTYPIRIAHLLELTAGLADLSWQGLEHSDPAPIALADALALEHEGLIAHWPPGTAHSYTNAAAGPASLVIERLSGIPFDTFVEQRVLVPMGMTRSSLLPTAVALKRLARGHRADGVTQLPYWHMLFRGFGALNATPVDMGRFLESMLRRAQTQPRVLEARSTRAATVGLTLGYGLGIYAAVRNGHVFYTHGGDADGYRSRYGLLTDAGRGYFVVINADQPATLDRMREAIEADLTRDLPRPEPPAPARLPRQRLAALTGTYYPSVTRFRLDDWQAGRLPRVTVRRQGGELIFRLRGRDQRLIAVTSDLFRRPGDPVATLAFVRDADGLHLQGELGFWTHTERQ